MKRDRRRRNPTQAEFELLEDACRDARAQDLAWAHAVLSQFIDGEDADWYQGKESAGDYLARAADEVWEMGDVYIGDDEQESATHELLKVTAIRLGGKPHYGRRSNPAESLARASVVHHASDTSWQPRIEGGTDLPPAAFNRRALMRGATVEIEHASDPHVALEIAMDHLAGDPSYYGVVPNPDPDACALGRWAWDLDPVSCGPGAPAATRQGASAAASRLARKRWTLPRDEQRVPARRLRR